VRHRVEAGIVWEKRVFSVLCLVFGVFKQIVIFYITRL